MPGKSRKISRRSSIGKHKKTMKRRMKNTRRNRHKKYQKGMMGGVTDPSTPPRRFNIVRLPPPQTPPGQQPVGPSNISPTDKNKKEDESNNSIQPTNLFL
jgi:hypothetical protein